MKEKKGKQMSETKEGYRGKESKMEIDERNGVKTTTENQGSPKNKGGKKTKPRLLPAHPARHRLRRNPPLTLRPHRAAPRTDPAGTLGEDQIDGTTPTRTTRTSWQKYFPPN